MVVIVVLFSPKGGWRSKEEMEKEEERVFDQRPRLDLTEKNAFCIDTTGIWLSRAAMCGTPWLCLLARMHIPAHMSILARFSPFDSIAYSCSMCAHGNLSWPVGPGCRPRTPLARSRCLSERLEGAKKVNATRKMAKVRADEYVCLAVCAMSSYGCCVYLFISMKGYAAVDKCRGKREREVQGKAGAVWVAMSEKAMDTELATRREKR